MINAYIQYIRNVFVSNTLHVPVNKERMVRATLNKYERDRYREYNPQNYRNIR